MADHPMLFSAPMVRALLAGTKTQTRRTIKPQPPAWATRSQELTGLNTSGEWRPWELFVWTEEQLEPKPLRRWPNDDGDAVHGWHGLSLRIRRGDRLWVREAHALLPRTAYRASVGTGTICQREHPSDGYTAAVFREGFDRSGRPSWRPSIHMPRWASRLTLLVTDVRVQRLQDISEADADAEGFGGGFPDRVMPEVFPPRDGNGWGDLSIRECYGHLWNHIQGPGSWDRNPWVAAYSFTCHRCNIDQMPEAAE